MDDINCEILRLLMKAGDRGMAISQLQAALLLTKTPTRKRLLQLVKMGWVTSRRDKKTDYFLLSKLTTAEDLEQEEARRSLINEILDIKEDLKKIESVASASKKKITELLKRLSVS